MTQIETSLATLVADEGRPVSGLRAWFVFAVVWLAGLAAAALVMFGRYEGGDAAALGLWGLALATFYLSICNVFLPLPTAWVILLLVSPECGPFEGAWARILVVTGAGAVGTAFANLNEYHALAVLFEHGLGARIIRTRVYQWAVRWFDRAPFSVLALTGFVPIPIDAIRWLAVLRRYSRVRFAAAYFVGRGLRYFIFAWLSVLLALSGEQILVIQVGLVVAAVQVRVAWGLYRRGRRRFARGSVAGELSEVGAAPGVAGWGVEGTVLVGAAREGGRTGGAVLGAVGEGPVAACAGGDEG